MAGVNRVNFDSEGVEVTLPTQRKETRVVKLPLGSLQNMKPQVGGFQPGRLVINVVGEFMDAPGTAIQEFDPPLQLKINYSPADHEFAHKENKPMKLAFWNGNAWVPFTSEKHQYKLYPNANPSSGGYAMVVIRSWGDPPISWGK